MSMIITKKGYVIYYNEGSFDEWCVYVIKPHSKKLWKPRDNEYFSWLRKLGKKYGNTEVYNDFLKIYFPINQNTSMSDVENIVNEVSIKYPNSEEWWIILALTIKAEEHRQNTYLGKTIKHLGVYNILKDEMKLMDVVTYMRGKSWRYLRDLMIERGIWYD